MTPCRLPPPSAILTEATLRSSADIDEHARYTITINMGGVNLPSSDDETQLPGFGALLDSLPESQRTLDHTRSSSSSPRLPQQVWQTIASRGAYGGHEARRANWQPYPPPHFHQRTYSRSQSPTASEHSEDGPQPRTARPTYTEEEIYFIWYHRDDLQLPWPQILELFNMHFGIRPRNGVQGIQCRYYRALDIHGVPKARARDRSLPNDHYGVKHYMPDKHWSWMRN